MPSALDFITATSALSPKASPFTAATPPSSSPKPSAGISPGPASMTGVTDIAPTGAVTTEKAPMSPAPAIGGDLTSFLSKPISSVVSGAQKGINSVSQTLQQKQSPNTQTGPTDTDNIPSLGDVAAKTGTGANDNGLTTPMRKQDWVDVLQLLGQPSQMEYDLASTAKETATGKPLPEYQDPSSDPNRPIIDAKSAIQDYNDQISQGVPEKTAFANAAIRSVGDIAGMVMIGNDVAQGLARGLAPNALIKPEITTLSRQDIADFIQGTKNAANLNLTPEAKQAIIDRLGSSDPAVKKTLFSRSGIDIVKAKPSVLGHILGVTDEEAQTLLTKTTGAGADGIRTGSSGALPGYKTNPEAGGMNNKGIPVGFGDEKPATSPLDFIKDNSIKDVIKDKESAPVDHSPTLPEGSESGGEGVKETSKPVGEGNDNVSIKSNLIPISQATEAGKEGKFWTVAKGVDSGYGSQVKSAFVDSSKLYKGKSSLDFIRERNLLTPEVQKQIDQASEGNDPNLEYKIPQDIAEAELKKEGYSGAHWTSEDDLNPTQYQIWDKSAIKHQSHADETFYHGTKETAPDIRDQAFHIRTEENAPYNSPGISLSADKSTAGIYGKKILELRISPEARIIPLEQALKESGLPADPSYREENEDKVISWAKKNGYDGIDLRGAKSTLYKSQNEVRIFNKNVLRKPDEISNGAIPKELQPLADEARKYGNAEEFVKNDPIIGPSVSMKIPANDIYEYSPKSDTKISAESGYSTKNPSRTSGPVTAFKDDSTGKYHLVDGAHRVMAAIEKGNEYIDANVGIATSKKGGWDTYDKSKLTDLYNKATQKGTESSVPVKTKKVSVPLDKDESAHIEAINNSIEEKKLMLDHLSEAMDAHPGKKLMKYVSRTTGQLPEFTGKPTRIGKNGKEIKNGIYAQRADDFMSHLGLEDTSKAQDAVDQYRDQVQRRKDLETAIKSEQKYLRQRINESKNPEAYKETANIEYKGQYTSDEKKAINDLMNRTSVGVSTEAPPEIKEIKAKWADQISKERMDNLVNWLLENKEVLGEDPDLDRANPEMVQEWLESADEQKENDDILAQIDAESEASSGRTLDRVIKKYKEDTGIDLSPEVTKNNHGVVPPASRGLRAPEFDWSKTHDIATLKLTRDTLERNIEKITPDKQSARILNEFYVDKIRENEEARIMEANDIRLRVRAKMKELGIINDPAARNAAQRFGEGLISLNQLQTELPKKWGAINSAVDFIRKEYDYGINGVWNPKRAEYGYKPVAYRGNYFRHYSPGSNPWYGLAGAGYDLWFNKQELPTEIAGITENFKPGKKFSTAELQRTGNKTKYDIIEGFDNWLDSMSKQAFHIDSIQRGRAIEKYVRQVARASRLVGDPLILNNFVSNLNEHVNLVAGKMSKLDRSIEDAVGRSVVTFMQRLTSVFGANVISANLSSALTHSIPLTFNVATVDKKSLMVGLAQTLGSPFMADRTSIGGVRSSFLTRRYPVQYVQPTKFQKTTNVLGYPFHVVDAFISHLAVASKYYEGIGMGLEPEEAMARADNYAQRIIGDRSIGNLPNIMSSKTLGALTQFQIEINDNMSVLIHDIPRWSSERAGKENAIDMVEITDKNGNKSWVRKEDITNYYKVASALVSFALFVHLYNWVMKKVKGSGKGLDPINLGLEAAGYNDDDIPFFPQKDQSAYNPGAALSTAGTELAGELPFSNIFTGGQYPVLQGLPNPITILQGIPTGTFTQNLESESLKGLVGFASPVGGGTQIKKTVGGLEAFGSEQPLDQTTTNAVKAAVFGQTALPSSQSKNDAYNAVTVQSIADQKFKPTFDSIRAQLASGDTAGATARYDALSADDKNTYAKLKAATAAKATIASERAMFDTVKNGRQLMASGKTSEAQALYNSLSPADQKVYDKVKAKYFPNNSATPTGSVPDDQPTVDSTGTPQYQPGDTSKPQGIIQTAINYAEALGTDPVTAFNRIFTGQRIVRVDNPGFLSPDSAVVVERMPLAASEAERGKEAAAGGISSSTMKGLQLDHIIPLEAGGSNTPDNFQLITTDQNENLNGLAESPIAHALEDGKISRAKAREYLIRYKAGTLKEPLTPAMQDEYKNKYGGEPITADEIVQLIDSGESK